MLIIFVLLYSHNHTWLNVSSVSAQKQHGKPSYISSKFFFTCSIVGNSSIKSFIFFSLIFVDWKSVCVVTESEFNISKVSFQSTSSFRYFAFLPKLKNFSNPVTLDISDINFRKF